MKTNLVRAALACAVLAFTGTAAFAEGTPLQGTPIVLEHDPAGIVATGTTDANGSVTFRDPAPGKYFLVIEGTALVAAMDRLTPRPTDQLQGPSVGLSVGGLFGGSKQSNSQTNGHPGLPGGTSHDSSSSGGGVGVGVSVPVGGGGSGSGGGNAPMITFTATVSQSNPAAFVPQVKDLNEQAEAVSVEVSYCRDSASKGMRIGFTVPASPAGTADNLTRIIFVGGTVKF